MSSVPAVAKSEAKITIIKINEIKQQTIFGRRQFPLMFIVT
jgi:hypothetical protein